MNEGQQKKSSSSDRSDQFIGLAAIVFIVALAALLVFSFFHIPKKTESKCWYCDGCGYNCDIPNPTLEEFAKYRYPCKICKGKGHIS